MLDKKVIEEWKKLNKIIIGTTKGGQDGQLINFYTNEKIYSAKCFGHVPAGEAILLKDDNNNLHIYANQKNIVNSKFNKNIQYRKIKKIKKENAIFAPMFLVYGSTPNDKTWVGAPGTGIRSIYISDGDIILKVFDFDATNPFVARMSLMPEYYVISVKFPYLWNGRKGIITILKINKISLIVEQTYSYTFETDSQIYLNPNFLATSPIEDWRKSLSTDFRDYNFLNNASGIFYNIIVHPQTLMPYPALPPDDPDNLINRYRYNDYCNINYERKEILEVTLFNFINIEELNFNVIISKFSQNANQYNIDAAQTEIIEQNFILSNDFINFVNSSKFRFAYYSMYRIEDRY